MSFSRAMHTLVVGGFLLGFYLIATPARADQHYSREVFFDNSLAPGSYPYSEGNVSSPSALTLIDGKLPVTTEQFISGPNALKLQWTSAPKGSWDAQIKMYRWRNRDIGWAGDSLYLWLWSDEGIAAKDLPHQFDGFR